MKKVVVILAEGFEETEAVQPIDLMRRAGLTVKIVGLEHNRVTGGHGITMVTDAILPEFAEEFDALVLPGGAQGSENLSNSRHLGHLVKDALDHGKLVGAICAAPAVVLGKRGFLKGRKYTCYPGMEKEVTDGSYLNQPVVEDGSLITSQGVGTSAAFALTLIRRLAGDQAATTVGQHTLLV